MLKIVTTVADNFICRVKETFSRAKQFMHALRAGGKLCQAYYLRDFGLYLWRHIKIWVKIKTVKENNVY